MAATPHLPLTGHAPAITAPALAATSCTAPEPEPTAVGSVGRRGRAPEEDPFRPRTELTGFDVFPCESTRRG